MTSLSIIIATEGRDTLTRTIESVQPQLDHGDQIIITRLDCPWGHQARNQAMPHATGTHLMFIDDDDTYTEGALELVRSAATTFPDRVNIFKMRGPGRRELWQQPVVACGNVGTPMWVVPNDPERLGQWDERIYEGDYAFITSTLAKHKAGPVFHQDVIALIRPEAA